jgi:DNA-binding CsgD family transcriptional regulator
LVFPLPESSAQSLASGRLALVVAVDSAGRGPLSVEAMRALFGFTGAEARLAHSMAEGRTLEEHATTSGITVESARSLLKRVFERTGTSRQAELVRLLTRAPRLRR